MLPKGMMPLPMQVLHRDRWCARRHVGGLSGAAAELGSPLTSCVHGFEAVLCVIDGVLLRLPLQQACKGIGCYRQSALVQMSPHGDRIPGLEHRVLE